jgi:hypothetical protein
MVDRRKPGRLDALVRWALASAGDRRKLPVLGLFPVGDYALPFLPNQVLMMAVALIHPRNWALTALVFTFGSAIGAVATGFAIQSLQTTFFADPAQSMNAGAVMAFIRDWGITAVAVLALLPVPPRTAVLVTAYAGVNPLLIGGAVAIGRCAPALALCFVAARAPNAAARFPTLARALARARDFAKW